MTKLDKLIGIPFKLGREDFNACDCVGLLWLYYNYIYNKDIVSIRNNKRSWFRNTRNDLRIMVRVLKGIGRPVLSCKELRKDDIVILKADRKKKLCALGVCIDNFEVLCMRGKRIGSVLVKKKYLEEIFIRGYRLNETF